MTLSVVIPTFNEEELLPRLLVSLRKQTFQDFEIVVADAHSTDATCAIAALAGCKVVDGGLPAVGRNLGAKAAKGDLFLFLDADVELDDPHMLEQLLHQVDVQKLDLATVYVKHMSDRTLDVWLTNFYNFYISATQTFFPHSHGFCILARRWVHEAIQGFDESIRLAEDHDYGQRAVQEGARYSVLSTIRVPVSARRFDRDGYFSLTCKYVLCELHMMAIGPVRSDIFKYRFGHAKRRVKQRA